MMIITKYCKSCKGQFKTNSRKRQYCCEQCYKFMCMVKCKEPNKYYRDAWEDRPVTGIREYRRATTRKR